MEVKEKGFHAIYEGRGLEDHERVVCIPKVAGLNYEDLCIHPNFYLPEGYKAPTYDVFIGIGNPLVYLRDCNQL